MRDRAFGSGRPTIDIVGALAIYRQVDVENCDFEFAVLPKLADCSGQKNTSTPRQFQPENAHDAGHMT
jgi:hypothetical protein